MTGDATRPPEPSPFRTVAEKLWNAGFQAIPLSAKSKDAFVVGWPKWSSEPVSEEQKAEWLANPASAHWNVGVPCGEASDLCIIDIDTRDPTLAAMIEGLLPPSPWRRVGAKGAALAYKWSGIPNFQIKDAVKITDGGGGMLVEMLSNRKQIVVPPSIHPDTGLEYVANCDLFDPEVRKQLLTLPPGLEGMLRAAIEEAGYRLSISGHTRVTDWVSTGSRDNKMIAVAGHYARGVMRGELPFMQAVSQMVAWNETSVEKVAGDDIDIRKGVQRIADFIIRDVLGERKLALPDGWDDGLTPALRTSFGFDQFTEVNEKWNALRIRAYLRDNFALHDAGSNGRRDALEFALDRLAVAELDLLDEQSLINYIVKAGQFDVTPGTIKRVIAKKRGSGIEGTDHAEIASALSAKLSEEGEIAFDQGHFWQWRGSHWEQMTEDFLMKRIIRDFGALPSSKRFNDYKSVLNTMQSMITKPIRTELVAGINFANGYLDTDMNLRAHSPEFGCTFTLPYRYTPGAGSGALRFHAFLDSVWQDAEDKIERVQAFREAISVTLFGVAPLMERCFCLHGPPKTGKSQLLKIISGLVPGAATAALPPNQWGERFSLAELAGKMVNLCGELSNRGKIDGQIFKSVVSGEMLTAQFKNKPLFKLQPNCAHWFASNHIPMSDDSSSGFIRRWLMLVFERPVSDKDKEIDLGTRIVTEEREEIVAWAVEAIRDVMSRKDFILPRSHVERMSEIARANNSLRTFVLDSQKVLVREMSSPGVPMLRTSEEVLFRAYFAFTVGVGNAKPVSLTTFRQAMRELGSELGFRAVLETEPSGRQVCSYEGITLAEKGSMRLVSGGLTN